MVEPHARDQSYNHMAVEAGSGAQTRHDGGEIHCRAAERIQGDWHVK